MSARKQSESEPAQRKPAPVSETSPTTVGPGLNAEETEKHHELSRKILDVDGSTGIVTEWDNGLGGYRTIVSFEDGSVATSRGMTQIESLTNAVQVAKVHNKARNVHKS